MSKATKRTQALTIWMNGLPVCNWEKSKGVDHLNYFDTWVNSETGRFLSLSLPFTPGNQGLSGVAVGAWFDNLLPDSDAIRRRLALRHKTASANAFDLLVALGRDCAGAIQLLPPDQTPGNLFAITGLPLNEAKVAQILRNVAGGTVLGQANDEMTLRLSVAGAQEKTALLWHQGQWWLPQGSTPTTHIFKLPIGLVGAMQADMRTSVENEWLCAQLVHAYGLAVAPCEIARFEEQKVLVVTRFDRQLANDGRWIIRLPQEDLCQALGIAAINKYQTDGGPGIAAIMAVLAASSQAEQDRRDFFKAQIVFWLLAATDGHAKNFSIAHLPGSQYRMTPLYDILSAHPVIGNKRNQIAPKKAKLAMAVRGSSNYYLLEQIQKRHWLAQAKQVGLSADMAGQIIAELLETTDSVLARVEAQLPGDFPADLAAAIFAGIRRHCARLALG
jgi:serine/threonine-protein kinase HipA